MPSTSRAPFRLLLLMLPPALLGGPWLTAAPGQMPDRGGTEPPTLTPLPFPDVPAAEFADAGLPLWVILLGAAVLTGLVALVVLLLRLKPAVAAPPALQPLRRATDRLTVLLNHLDEHPPAETGHLVSLILREYQQDRYGVPAPYLTSEELYGQRYPGTREDLRVKFGPVAEVHDRLAFAPAPSTRADSEALIQSALQALKEERFHGPSPGGPPPIPPRTAPARV